MSDDIEEEIRRRILEDRRADGSRSTQNGVPTPPVISGPEAHQPYYMQKNKKRGGIIGAIIAGLAALGKFFGPLLVLLGKLKFLLIGLKLLTFGKLLLTFGSMLISMWFWAKLFGWPFGVGIVLLIFIHECGHALAAKLRGLPVSNMIFVPFMGAVVFTRGGRSLVEQAFIGIMGPVVGSLACFVCVAIYFFTHHPFWLALASWGFFVNLFNLAPTVPLDGGWIAPVFSPKILAFGLILIFVLAWRNPLIWILAIMSFPRVVAGWKADPKTQPYYQVTAGDRWRFGVAYFGLAALLAVSYLSVSHLLGARAILI